MASTAPRMSPEGDGSASVLLLPGRTRLVLAGEVDTSLGEELTRSVAEVEDAGLPVEVDVRHVTFMDSSVVSALAGLAFRYPHRLVFIKPPDVVRFLLEVTNLGEMVDIVDDVPSDDVLSDTGQQPLSH
ncbi:STAS domain-containing protein [Georgenia muralis]|uniref:Anti-anti-sigma regulatory factor n=1 Tax=Georgenia muralis TaxID=154117 RepID=A0A3N4Z4J1_9MICO|nr:STAS domain-containing protein [Georgenia muralis]RPF26804.1 anti-anti-sigma regulatory factor [Georgenia muralis]